MAILKDTIIQGNLTVTGSINGTSNIIITNTDPGAGSALETNVILVVYEN